MAKIIFLDFSGLSAFKNKINNLISQHTGNTDVHLTSQERYKINNFPSKLSSFENDMDYITRNDFLTDSEYDAGGALENDILDQKDLDGENATYTA